MDRYIDHQKDLGSLDSTGAFTVDPGLALGKMGAYRLPTAHHNLLKFMQYGVRWAARSIDVRLSTTTCSVSFSAPGGPLIDAIVEAGSMDDPQFQVMEVARTLLYASASEPVEARWTVVSKDSTATLKASGGRVELTEPCCMGGEPRHEFTLEYKRGWRFWKGAQRRAEVVKMVREWAKFCEVEIRLDGRVMELEPAAVLNDHLSEMHGSKFNPATGVMHSTGSPVAASNLLYLLSESGRTGVRLEIPPEEAYRDAEDCLVWRQTGERPDGFQVPAWMVQFVASDRNIGFQELPAAPVCRAIIALNIHGPGSMEGVRVRAVHQGILALESQESPEDDSLQHLMGCSVLIADERLQSDLSELKIVKNEAYYEVLRGLIPVVEQGHEYFNRGSAELKFG